MSMKHCSTSFFMVICILLFDGIQTPPLRFFSYHVLSDYSVGQFYEDARQASQDILKNGRVPIVTGGTGLYLRWYPFA